MTSASRDAGRPGGPAKVQAGTSKPLGPASAPASLAAPVAAVKAKARGGASAARPIKVTPAAPEAVRSSSVTPRSGVPQPVGKAQVRPRHRALLWSFLAVVVLPVVLSGAYLFTVAKDQYVSTVGFSVRSEEMLSALSLLGGLSSLSGTSSSDADILYQFVRSQDLVSGVDQVLDLRKLYSKPDFDPVFAFDPAGSIEDLTDYWARMVEVSYDSGTGLIELRVHAFAPQDAQQIAQQIFDQSSEMINKLSAIARADATSYAKQELDESLVRLSDARVRLTEFRSRTQIVDPQAAIQGQLGLLTQLQEQQAHGLIELKLLRETMREDDPRIGQAERRLAVIEEMIVQERRKFGIGTADASGQPDDSYSALIGEFERLSVEQEFAEKAYLAALTSYDSAKAEAQRKSRYLAAYVSPTLPEEALYPRRLLLTAVVGGFALLFWLIGVLIYYSVRDRR